MARNQFTTNKENGIFNWSLRNPFHGVKASQDETDEVVARIINLALPQLPGIVGSAISELELDLEDYALYIVGSPTVIARMGGSSIGYSIHVSVYPRPDTLDGKGNPELVG